MSEEPTPEATLAAPPAETGQPTGIPAPLPTPTPPDQSIDMALLASHLPEEIRNDETLARFKGPGDLAKSYLEARKKLGNSVSIPASDASPEDIQEFWSRLGRPEDAGGYKLPEMELPEQLKMDDATGNWFKETGHKLGLNQEQMSGLWREYGSKLRGDLEGTQAENVNVIAEVKETLKKDWGSKYEEYTDAASSTYNQLFSEEARSLFAESGLENDPDMIKAFYEISKKITGDNIQGTSNQQTVVDQTTPEQRRNELLDKPDYWSNPELQEQARKLNEQIADKQIVI